MSRGRSLVVAALIVVVLSAALGYVWREQKQREREATYQATLLSYSQALRPGMTRKDVEEYLRAKGAEFHRMCCVGERSALTDLVKIGEQSAPWYCSEHNVYVAFQFSSSEAHPVPQADDSDVLKSITISHWLEACL